MKGIKHGTCDYMVKLAAADGRPSHPGDRGGRRSLHPDEWARNTRWPC